MGNNPTKESRSAPQVEVQRPLEQTISASSSHRPSASTVQTTSTSSQGESGSGRRRGSSRHEISLFRIGSGQPHEPDPSDPSARRETRAEREARKREKERELRAIERERSIKDEGVDGGYLVTLGTYTGPEDFSKTVVRQLMIERRLAPFWKGLQDHEDSWADNQLVAVVRGEPLPEAGPAPTPEQLGGVGKSSPERTTAHGSTLTVPSTTHIERPRSPSNPEHHSNTFGSPPTSFRTRARTLVSLSTSRNHSQSDMTPSEIMLPKDPYVNGQPTEAFLYKNASECPICFLYYPPYLNKTRCCDQPICSECFVQIKRPDPHPPEHHDDDPNDPNASANGEPRPEAEYELVSEVATCPFCKQPEFGVTYDAPPFRRGLVYNEHHRLGTSHLSAMSSTSSVNSQSSPSLGNRRRATSLAADAPNVITTDIVRPDWRKKLDDARAHALRRAAAATALHNAAYMLGNTGDASSRFAIGRRRRTFFGDVAGNGPSQGDALGSLGQMGALLAAAGDRDRERAGSTAQQQGEGAQSSDLFPGRGSSRRSRVEDLEELMYMEAIRLSLASAEEERKKQEKEDAKRAKKDQKQREKDAKKAAKDAKRRGSTSMYSASINDSQASGLTGGGGGGGGESSSAAVAPAMARGASGGGGGKGKAPASAEAGSGTPSPEPTPKDDPQAFLEQSRANIQSTPVPIPAPQSLSPQPHRQALRHLSSASSVSSLNDSQETSPNASGLHLDQTVQTSASGPYSETPPGNGAGTEPMFNFRSLAAVIGDEEGKEGHPMVEHVENVAGRSVSPQRSPLAVRTSGESSSPPKSGMVTPPERPLSAGERLFGTMSPPTSPGLSDFGASVTRDLDNVGRDDEGAALAPQESNPYDAKHYGDISILDSGLGQRLGGAR